jgi:hypothetical protein
MTVENHNDDEDVTLGRRARHLFARGLDEVSVAVLGDHDSFFQRWLVEPGILYRSRGQSVTGSPGARWSPHHADEEHRYHYPPLRSLLMTNLSYHRCRQGEGWTASGLMKTVRPSGSRGFPALLLDSVSVIRRRDPSCQDSQPAAETYPAWLLAWSIRAPNLKLPDSGWTQIAQRAPTMGIMPLWLFPRRSKRPRCAIVVGDRRFRLYVASDPQQRTELERLFGNRPDDTEHRCPALLMPQPTWEPAAVAVRIEGTTVGYLHLTAAREFLTALHITGADRAACAAMIIARREPSLGGRTHFRVRVDVTAPLKLVEPEREMAVRKRA